MNKIVNNENNLNIKDIDVIKDKVRALIIDDNENIILINYADVFMLPGGKIEKEENIDDALKREIKEELGLDINLTDEKPLVRIDNYLKNYPVRDSSEKINKLTRTIYYVINENYNVDFSKINLSNSEKNGKFEIIKVNLKDLKSIILNYKSTNERYEIFKNELLQVIDNYYNVKKNTSQLEQKLIDLHAHTNYSDGELTPKELIQLAVDKNIGTIAITDHDTIAGIKTINRNDDIIVNSGIKVINGIELSAKVSKGRMHILGYDIDLNNKTLNKKMIDLKNNSINYVLSLMEQIKRDYGIRFNYEDIKELVNANHNLGRPDLAKLCVKYGYATTMQDAFDKYLIDAYNKIRQTNKGLCYQECLELITNSGGIPVLAHPKTLELSKKEFLILLKEMISYGLKGIEVYHSIHSKEERDYYLEIAKEYNLLISGGSDYHGKNVKPDVELGTGINHNLKIKELSILNKIKNY